MEEIINKLLEIDSKAKSVINEYQDKKNNLDLFVSEEIAKRKKEIDQKYNFRIDFQKKEYDRKLEYKKQAMNDIKDKGIIELQAQYEMEKIRLTQEIFEMIIKEN